MMLRQANIGDHILCSRLGAEEFKMLSISRDEYVVESTIFGTRHDIYKAHCSLPRELVIENRNRRAARAGTIGCEKIRPGKKK